MSSIPKWDRMPSGNVSSDNDQLCEANVICWQRGCHETLCLSSCSRCDSLYTIISAKSTSTRQNRCGQRKCFFGVVSCLIGIPFLLVYKFTSINHFPIGYTLLHHFSIRYTLLHHFSIGYTLLHHFAIDGSLFCHYWHHKSYCIFPLNRLGWQKMCCLWLHCVSFISFQTKVHQYNLDVASKFEVSHQWEMATFSHGLLALWVVPQYK